MSVTITQIATRLLDRRFPFHECLRLHGVISDFMQMCYVGSSNEYFLSTQYVFGFLTQTRLQGTDCGPRSVSKADRSETTQGSWDEKQLSPHDLFSCIFTFACRPPAGGFNMVVKPFWFVSFQPQQQRVMPWFGNKKNCCSIATSQKTQRVSGTQLNSTPVSETNSHVPLFEAVFTRTPSFCLPQ